jgi:Uma2 family endonuclease
MAADALPRMTEDAFFAWQERQGGRYEFVDGLPIERSGADRRHDQIVVNTLVELGNRLRGGPCRPFTADTAVRTVSGRLRRPDVGVECGPRHDRAFVADRPRLVVEVLSPSTRELDMFGKLDEYKEVESLAAILIVEPNAPTALLWARGADRSWAYSSFDNLEAAVELPDLGVVLPLSEVYADLTFEPAEPQ